MKIERLKEENKIILKILENLDFTIDEVKKVMIDFDLCTAVQNKIMSLLLYALIERAIMYDNFTRGILSSIDDLHSWQVDFETNLHYYIDNVLKIRKPITETSWIAVKMLYVTRVWEDLLKLLFK